MQPGAAAPPAVRLLLPWPLLGPVLPVGRVGRSHGCAGGRAAAAGGAEAGVVCGARRGNHAVRLARRGLADQPRLWRLCYFYLSSFQFRFRFYACWSLVEAAGVLCRFPHPSNVSPWECETATSPSLIIASWNVSVHRFLRAYVHTRLQLPSRPARRLGAFAVSAFWHGMHAGYYLFFAGLFAMVLVERLVR